MPTFKAVLLEHGYASTACEQTIVADAGGSLVVAEGWPLNEALAECRDVDGILCRRMVITQAMMRAWRRCKTIVRYGIGTDNVDVPAATAQGIIVGHVPDYCLDEVSAHAVALLLACVRRIVQTQQKMACGLWDVSRDNPIRRMAGRTLGLVGFGQIGQRVAQKLSGWNLKIIAADPYVDPAIAVTAGVEIVDLLSLCRRADYISLHVPLNPETHHLLGTETFSVTKPDAILVNTARGAVVDNTALLEALDNGRLGQAGLDVFEEEPLPAGAPWACHPRVTVTDHAAWYSEEAQAQLQKSAAEELVRVCTGGLPYSLANPEVLQRIGRLEDWTPPKSMAWQFRRLEMLNRARRAG